MPPVAATQRLWRYPLARPRPARGIPAQRAYTAAFGSQAAGQSTFQLPLVHPVAAHDALVVAAASNSAVTAAVSVADSAGPDLFTLIYQDTTRSPNLSVFVALDVAAGAAQSDTITVTFAGTATIKNVIVRGCPGMARYKAIDQHPFPTDAASGTAYSAGPTGTLAAAGEWALAFLSAGAAAGVPGGWTGGFTGQMSVGAGPFLTVADQIAAGTAPLSVAAAGGSSTWTMGLLTLSPVPMPALVQPPPPRPRSWLIRRPPSLRVPPPGRAPVPAVALSRPGPRYPARVALSRPRGTGAVLPVTPAVPPSRPLRGPSPPRRKPLARALAVPVPGVLPVQPGPAVPGEGRDPAGVATAGPGASGTATGSTAAATATGSG